jgi:hypothetical protein
MLMRGFWAASVLGDGGASFGSSGTGAQEGVAAIGFDLAKRRHRETSDLKVEEGSGDAEFPPVRMLRCGIAIRERWDGVTRI